MKVSQRIIDEKKRAADKAPKAPCKVCAKCGKEETDLSREYCRHCYQDFPKSESKSRSPERSPDRQPDL